MKFIRKIAHLLVPRESNNQKAKLLHSSSLTLITFAFIFYQLAISLIPSLGSRVLGYAANISPEEVIRLTNEKRINDGLLPLEENSTLSQAAQAKGADMLVKGYWAHVAPDGTQPWQFFTNFGYKYRYAGENLAKDFSNPQSTVDAWMASPSHRENLLSPKYKEIGVAVVEGNLAGIDTTIIVQFFGTKYVDTMPVAPIAKAKELPVNTPISKIEEQLAIITAPSQSKRLVSPFNATKNISLLIAGLLLIILVIDGVIVSKRNIVRIGGRSLAHFAFLGMIVIITLLLKAGQII